MVSFASSWAYILVFLYEVLKYPQNHSVQLGNLPVSDLSDFSGYINVQVNYT